MKRKMFSGSFQSFLEANSKCWWNAALVDATRQLRYKGHVSPGVLMVGGPPCALEVLRAAWARNVLRPPADHAITCLGKYLFSPPHLHEKMVTPENIPFPRVIYLEWNDSNREDQRHASIGIGEEDSAQAERNAVVHLVSFKGGG